MYDGGWGEGLLRMLDASVEMSSRGGDWGVPGAPLLAGTKSIDGHTGGHFPGTCGGVEMLAEGKTGDGEIGGDPSGSRTNECRSRRRLRIDKGGHVVCRRSAGCARPPSVYLLGWRVVSRAKH